MSIPAGALGPDCLISTFVQPGIVIGLGFLRQSERPDARLDHGLHHLDCVIDLAFDGGNSGSVSGDDVRRYFARRSEGVPMSTSA